MQRHLRRSTSVASTGVDIDEIGCETISTTSESTNVDMGFPGPPLFETGQIFGCDVGADFHDADYEDRRSLGLAGISIAPLLGADEDKVRQLHEMRAETERWESVLWDDVMPLWPSDRAGEPGEALASEWKVIPEAGSNLLADSCWVQDRSLVTSLEPPHANISSNSFCDSVDGGEHEPHEGSIQTLQGQRGSKQTVRTGQQQTMTKVTAARQPIDTRSKQSENHIKDKQPSTTPSLANKQRHFESPQKQRGNPGAMHTPCSSEELNGNLINEDGQCQESLPVSQLPTLRQQVQQNRQLQQQRQYKSHCQLEVGNVLRMEEEITGLQARLLSEQRAFDEERRKLRTSNQKIMKQLRDENQQLAEQAATLKAEARKAEGMHDTLKDTSTKLSELRASKQKVEARMRKDVSSLQSELHMVRVSHTELQDKCEKQTLQLVDAMTGQEQLKVLQAENERLTLQIANAANKTGRQVSELHRTLEKKEEEQSELRFSHAATEKVLQATVEQKKSLERMQQETLEERHQELDALSDVHHLVQDEFRRQIEVLQGEVQSCMQELERVQLGEEALQDDAQKLRLKAEVSVEDLCTTLRGSEENLLKVENRYSHGEAQNQELISQLSREKESSQERLDDEFHKVSALQEELQEMHKRSEDHQRHEQTMAASLMAREDEARMNLQNVELLVQYLKDEAVDENSVRVRAVLQKNELEKDLEKVQVDLAAASRAQETFVQNQEIVEKERALRLNEMEVELQSASRMAVREEHEIVSVEALALRQESQFRGELAALQGDTQGLREIEGMRAQQAKAEHRDLERTCQAQVQALRGECEMVRSIFMSEMKSIEAEWSEARKGHDSARAALESLQSEHIISMEELACERQSSRQSRQSIRSVPSKSSIAEKRTLLSEMQDLRRMEDSARVALADARQDHEAVEKDRCLTFEKLSEIRSEHYSEVARWKTDRRRLEQAARSLRDELEDALLLRQSADSDLASEVEDRARLQALMKTQIQNIREEHTRERALLRKQLGELSAKCIVLEERESALVESHRKELSEGLEAVEQEMKSKDKQCAIAEGEVFQEESLSLAMVRSELTEEQEALQAFKWKAQGTYSANQEQSSTSTDQMCREAAASAARAEASAASALEDLQSLEVSEASLLKSALEDLQRVQASESSALLELRNEQRCCSLQRGEVSEMHRASNGCFEELSAVTPFLSPQRLHELTTLDLPTAAGASLDTRQHLGIFYLLAREVVMLTEENMALQAESARLQADKEAVALLRAPFAETLESTTHTAKNKISSRSRRRLLDELGPCALRESSPAKSDSGAGDTKNDSQGAEICGELRKVVSERDLLQKEKAQADARSCKAIQELEAMLLDEKDRERMQIDLAQLVEHVEHLLAKSNQERKEGKETQDNKLEERLEEATCRHRDDERRLRNELWHVNAKEQEAQEELIVSRRGMVALEDMLEQNACSAKLNSRRSEVSTGSPVLTKSRTKDAVSPALLGILANADREIEELKTELGEKAKELRATGGLRGSFGEPSKTGSPKSEKASADAYPPSPEQVGIDRYRLSRRRQKPENLCADDKDARSSGGAEKASDQKSEMVQNDEEDVEDPRVLFKRAEALCEAQRFSAAVPAYRKVIELLNKERDARDINGSQPANAAAMQRVEAEVWAHLGVATQSLDKIGDAIAAYTRAVELDPSLHVCLANLASLYLYLGETTLACKMIDQALDLDAGNTTYLDLRSEIKSLSKTSVETAPSRWSATSQKGSQHSSATIRMAANVASVPTPNNSDTQATDKES